MFDKFGNFDSSREINNKAEELKAAGLLKEIRELAQENGLDIEDADDFIEGVTEELTTPTLAASGKIRLEIAEYKIEGILADWAAELDDAIIDNEDLAKAVRSKRKSLAGYIAATAEYGYKHRATVDKRIVALTNDVKKIIGTHEFSIGIPDRRCRRQIMKSYFLGGDK